MMGGKSQAEGEPMLTPWGNATRVIYLEKGISFVVTAEHGGLILDREYAEAKLSFSARKRGRCLGDSYAFEMDYAWAIVLWELPHLRVEWIGAEAPGAGSIRRADLVRYYFQAFPRLPERLLVAQKLRFVQALRRC
jgi:hypothetical protein